MITVITGTPGAGKTALAVDLLLREYADRPLFIDNLNGLKLEHTEIDVMEWHKEVPDGALIVCDEIQRKWRPRGPGSKVPDCIAALETHRHRGIDFILITQNVKLIDSNVRALVGRHLHIRDTGWMGRWLYEWPECDVNNSWKRCENKRRYKLPTRVFDKYTSASMHIKPVRNRPLLLYILAGAVLAFLYLAWSLYGSFKADQQPAPAAEPTLPGTATLVQQGTSIAAQAMGLPQVLPPPPSTTTAKLKIDDRVDWIPRISHMPETAPAYDEIRKIQAFPIVVGGVCFKGECRCFTQQGTNAGLTHDECLTAINNPRFNAYDAPPPVQTAAAPQVQRSTAPEDLPPEVKHVIAKQAHDDRRAVTAAAKAQRLANTGSL